MIPFDPIPAPAVLPVTTAPAELAQSNELITYAFTPDPPQPKPK